MGLLDISRGRFVYVRGLGFKDHGRARNALDPSNRDGAIAIEPWTGVAGMYSPTPSPPTPIAEFPTT